MKGCVNIGLLEFGSPMEWIKTCEKYFSQTRHSQQLKAWFVLSLCLCLVVWCCWDLHTLRLCWVQSHCPLPLKLCTTWFLSPKSPSLQSCGLPKLKGLSYIHPTLWCFASLFVLSQSTTFSLKRVELCGFHVSLSSCSLSCLAQFQTAACAWSSFRQEQIQCV